MSEYSDYPEAARRIPRVGGLEPDPEKVAALLVVADAVSRALVAPAELPIGAITAAIGAPLFAWLLLRTP